MLSYRHAFHAGNFADILKHLALAGTLDHLLRKPGPLLYVDTHAGAGEYSLEDAMARKTAEAEAGILRLDLAAIEATLPEEARPVLALYRQTVAPWLARKAYPGSPALAAALLRPRDLLHLFELHPRDFDLLAGRFRDDRRVRCEKSDGFHSVRSLLPPAGRRAAVLIDPSYEIKDDFRRVSAYVRDSWKRMPSAHLLLWYPVLRERQDEQLAKSLVKAGLRDLWRFELGVAANPGNAGMTASGILSLNPPWTLPAQLREILPASREPWRAAKAGGRWSAWRGNDRRLAG